MKQRRGSLIIKLALLCLVAYVAMNLVNLQLSINQAEEDLQILQEQIEHQKRENAMLEEATKVDMDESFVAGIARSELGLVMPGERVFIDISN